MTTSRHLVCLSPYVPYDGIDHAGGDYLLEYLRAVSAEGWQVTVVCPNHADNRSSFDRAPEWLEVVLSPKERVPRSLRSLRLLVHGANGTAPERWMRRLSSDALAAIDTAAVLDLHWMGSIQYARILRDRRPGVPILATPHDVKSEGISRAASGAARQRVRLAARAALPRVHRLERRALDLCDRIFVFKEQDIALVRALGVTATVKTTPPLVRLPDRRPAPNPSSRLVLFTAAFWREENDEAARWFLTEVWPRVPCESGLRVRFAGSRPSAWLRSQACERVEVTGYVPDLLEAYRGVGIVVAPLRRGAGLKFKVAQAIAMGFPVIATSVALEGIDDLAGQHVAEPANTAEAFADSLLVAMNGLPRRVTEAVRLAELMRDRLDFPRHIAVQVRAYDDLLSSHV
jgi:glycosyltransferase involved in cell wall biosynthesis